MFKLGALFAGLGFAAAVLWGIWNYEGLAYPDAVKQLHQHPKEVVFANDGAFGSYDRAQLQRGFAVYKAVCSSCHSMKLISFNSMRDLGYSEVQIKALAKTYDVPTIDDKGEPTTRKGLPSDNFPGPYANDEAGRAANNGALPPDMSLLASAREEGPRYIYSLVTGYGKNNSAQYKMLEESTDSTGHKTKVEKLAKYETPDGKYYNPYFSNLNISMPPPLASDGLVDYTDGTKATREQMAKDVSAFLTWTSEPKLEARKRMGTNVLAFLAVLIVLTYLSKRKIWADIK